MALYALFLNTKVHTHKKYLLSGFKHTKWLIYRTEISKQQI